MEELGILITSFTGRLFFKGLDTLLNGSSVNYRRSVLAAGHICTRVRVLGTKHFAHGRVFYKRTQESRLFI